MLRAVVLAAIASACISCKPGAPVDPIGYGSSTSSTPGRAPVRRSAGAPKAVLAGKHRAPVRLASAVPVPGGSVVVYTYGRLQSYVGERTAAGHDVVAELAAERQRCEDGRAALDPGEREWIEGEYPSCEVIAGTTLFGDDQLVPECEALAVAHFDADGTLLSQVDVGGSCLSRLGSFEAYDLTPEADDELMLIATFERFGELAQGGWGRTRQETSMHVLAVQSGVELVEQLEVELDVSADGGSCSSGIERSARVPGLGVIEVYSQPWSDCTQDACIDATEAEEAEAAGEPVEELPICPQEPVTAARTRWVPEEHSWTVLEEFAFEGTQLPDGIRR